MAFPLRFLNKYMYFTSSSDCCKPSQSHLLVCPQYFTSSTLYKVPPRSPQRINRLQKNKRNGKKLLKHVVHCLKFYFLKVPLFFKNKSTLSSCSVLTEYHHSVDTPWGKSVTCKTRDGVHNHTFLAPPPSCFVPVVILVLAAIGGDFFKVRLLHFYYSGSD